VTYLVSSVCDYSNQWSSLQRTAPAQLNPNEQMLIYTCANFPRATVDKFEK